MSSRPIKIVDRRQIHRSLRCQQLQLDSIGVVENVSSGTPSRSPTSSSRPGVRKHVECQSGDQNALLLELEEEILEPLELAPGAPRR